MTFNLLPQLGNLPIQPPVKDRALKPDIIRKNESEALELETFDLSIMVRLFYGLDKVIDMQVNVLPCRHT